MGSSNRWHCRLGLDDKGLWFNVHQIVLWLHFRWSFQVVEIQDLFPWWHNTYLSKCVYPFMACPSSNQGSPPSLRKPVAKMKQRCFMKSSREAIEPVARSYQSVTWRGTVDTGRPLSHHHAGIMSGARSFLMPYSSTKRWNSFAERKPIAERGLWHALLSHSVVSNSAILWTRTPQAPLSTGLSRQEYWSGLPCPLPGDLPNPGIEPVSFIVPALAGGFFTTSTILLEGNQKRGLNPTKTPPPPKHKHWKDLNQKGVSFNCS